jgi:MYXO-CTERM domain-containing protein
MGEGEEVEVTAMIEDLEGDSTTWSWDTDGDGTFGDRAGMTTYTIPAGTTDGPGAVRIGIQASDGTNTAERYRVINVTNVAPMITSSPPSLIASVGAPWVYPIEVLDPAGTADPLAYALVTAPERMVVGMDGRITWTPNERDVTVGSETVSVEVSVDDGDMGTTSQAFELTVSPNRAPSQPVPIYPIGDEVIVNPSPRLVAGNAVDPDVEDDLTYHFELDTVDTFDSPALVESGPVAETPGFSYFYVPEPLAPGRYFWRVWASDGIVATEPRSDSFSVYGDVAPTDGGGMGTTDGGVVMLPDGGTMERRGGCGCVVAPSSEPTPEAALAGLAVAFLLFRRKHPRPRKRR